MYPRASGGRLGPQTPPNFKRLSHTVHVLISILFPSMDVGISTKIQSCRFILPLRMNMITTHTFTMKKIYFLLS